MRLIYGYAPDGSIVRVDTDDLLDAVQEIVVAGTSTGIVCPECVLRAGHPGPWHIDTDLKTIWRIWPVSTA